MKNYKEAISIAVAGTTFGTPFLASQSEFADFGTCEIAINISTCSGSTPTLVVTPQISVDGVNWQAAKDLADVAIAFASINTADAAGVARHKYLPRIGMWVRMQYVATGTGISILGTTNLVVR